MNNKPNLIFDYETLSSDVSSCAVVDCAYYLFDWSRFTENPYTFQELIDNIQHIKLDTKEQIETYGYKVSKSTMDFWSKQDKVVRDRIKPFPTDVSLTSYMTTLLEYVKNTNMKYWWSRSNTFDPVILYRIAESVGRSTDLNTFFSYGSVRDIRTFIDAKLNFSVYNGFVPMEDKEQWNQMFQQHNCIHDVAADILRLQYITRIENDLENI